MLKIIFKFSSTLILLFLIHNCAPMYDWEGYENYYQVPPPQFKDYSENAARASGTNTPQAENILNFLGEEGSAGEIVSVANLSPEEERELIASEYANRGKPVPQELSTSLPGNFSSPLPGAPQVGVFSLIQKIEVQSTANSVRFIIQTSKLPQYQVNTLKDAEHCRIYIDFYQTQLATPTKQFKVDDAFVYQVRTGQFDATTARVVIDARQEIPYHVYCDQNNRTVILETKTGNRPKIEGNSPNPFIDLPDLEPYRPAEMGLAQELGLKIQRIIIDPGHGGTDPGAQSAYGLQENEVVYDIALRLQENLRRNGEYEAFLTRDYQENMPLEQRTAFANNMRGDLFISIHANAHRQPEKNGIETYYLALANDDESKLVAAAENSVAGMEYSNLSGLLENILKNSKTRESANLARLVQSQLVTQSGLSNRGVRHAGFVVLIGAKMPSILVEVGFLSNPNEAQMLGSENFRDTVARALFEGINEYARQSATFAFRQGENQFDK